MIQKITITDISIQDKQLVLTAIDSLANIWRLNYNCSGKQKDLFKYLKKHSLCHSIYTGLYVELHRPKVMQMTDKEKMFPNKKMVLETYVAIEVMDALNNIRSITPGPLLPRLDHMVHQIHKQLI